MKKDLQEITQNMFMKLKNILDNNINVFGFDDNFYLIDENTLYNINIEIVSVERKMRLNYNFDTQETLPDKLLKIITNFIENYTKKNKEIYYEHKKDQAYMVTIDFIKNKKQNTFFILKPYKIDNDQMIINIVQDAGQIGISATDLNKQTKSFLSKQERDNILQELIKDEIIYIEYDKANGRKKKIYRY